MMEILTASQWKAGPPDFVAHFAEIPQLLRTEEYRLALHDAAHTASLLNREFAFKREHWIAMDRGHAVGRVSANLSQTDPSRGYVGFFETDLKRPDALEVGRKLTDTACAWLKAAGVRTAYGPVNYSTWFTYRFRTDRNYGPRFVWEPNSPPEYASIWEALGFKPAANYTSRAYRDIDRLLELTKKAYDRACAAGYRTRPFDLAGNFAGELGVIEAITKASFTEAFLIEPITPETYRELYVEPLRKLASKYCFFVLDPSGKEVGYGFNLLDQDHLIWKTLAIHPSEHGKGLSTFFMHASCLQARADGIPRAVAALVKEEGASDFTVQKLAPHLDWIHEFSVYSRNL